MAFLDLAGLQSYDTKVKAWADGKFVAKVSGKGLSTNDYTTTEKNKLSGIAANAQVNVIESVKVNGTALTPSSKAVNVTVPTKTSQITNDSGFQNATQVNTLIANKIAGAYIFKGTVTDYSKLPTTGVVSGHVYNVTNADPAHNVKAGDNVAAVVEGSTITWDVLSGIVDLSNYVQKESGKVLSSNDFTDALLTKLNGLSNYTHPVHTAKAEGLYKVTVNNLGHVTAATAVEKADITALGIPAQDTVYTHPAYTSKTSGLYKITVDAKGHVSATASVAKADITALGIPAQDTTYAAITTSEIDALFA